MGNIAYNILRLSFSYRNTAISLRIVLYGEQSEFGHGAACNDCLSPLIFAIMAL